MDLACQLLFISREIYYIIWSILSKNAQIFNAITKSNLAVVWKCPIYRHSFSYTHIIFLSWCLPAREANNSWPEKKCKGMQTTESVYIGRVGKYQTQIRSFDYIRCILYSIIVLICRIVVWRPWNVSPKVTSSHDLRLIRPHN